MSKDPTLCQRPKSCKQPRYTVGGNTFKRCEYHHNIEKRRATAARARCRHDHSGRSTSATVTSNDTHVLGPTLSTYQCHFITRNQGRWTINIPPIPRIEGTLDLALRVISRCVPPNIPWTTAYNGSLDAMRASALIKAMTWSVGGITEEEPADLKAAVENFLPEAAESPDSTIEVQGMKKIPQTIYTSRKPPAPTSVSLAAFLEQLYRESPAIAYNCLELRGSGVDINDTTFYHDSMALEVVRNLCGPDPSTSIVPSGDRAKLLDLLLPNEQGWHAGTQLRRLESFRLMSTGGCVTGVHEDGGGCLTLVHVVHGAKIWSVFGPEGLEGEAEHMVVRSGDMLLMRPGVSHAVCTPISTLCTGRHFLNYDFLGETVEVCIRQARSDHVSTNEYLPTVQISLLAMAIALEDGEFVQLLDIGPRVFGYACTLREVIQHFDKMFPKPEAAATKYDKQCYESVDEVVKLLLPVATASLLRLTRIMA